MSTKEPPERIYGWLNSQLSIAQHYGGITYQGKHYQKPRLIKLHGVWHCSITGCRITTGIGYTPLQAYDDWLLRSLKA